MPSNLSSSSFSPSSAHTFFVSDSHAVVIIVAVVVAFLFMTEAVIIFLIYTPYNFITIITLCTTMAATTFLPIDSLVVLAINTTTTAIVEKAADLL